MVAARWRAAGRTRRWRAAVVSAVAAGAVAAVIAVGGQPPPGPPVLRVVAAIPLPGDSSRFDYASLDAHRGLLFAAHLGASDVLAINIHTRRVVRVIPHLPQVHGVLVVPALHRVYATATGINKVAQIDENSGQILGMTPTGDYPDGLAYDPRTGRLYVAAESGWVTVLTRHGRRLQVTGSDHLADGAHVVAVDPGTGRSYYPVPLARNGHPALLVCQVRRHP